jgi:hypothetical protein
VTVLGSGDLGRQFCDDLRSRYGTAQFVVDARPHVDQIGVADAAAVGAKTSCEVMDLGIRSRGRGPDGR